MIWDETQEVCEKRKSVEMDHSKSRKLGEIDFEMRALEVRKLKFLFWINHNFQVFFQKQR